MAIAANLADKAQLRQVEVRSRLGLVGAVRLPVRLEARVVGVFQIVLDDACESIDRAEAEIAVEHLGPIRPARRQLELRAEIGQVRVRQGRIDDAGGGLHDPRRAARVVENEDGLPFRVALPRIAVMF